MWNVEEWSGAYRDLEGERKVKKQLERPRREWKDNIKSDTQEIRREPFSCAYCNEASVSTKGGEFLDYLRKYKVLKKDFAPCSYNCYYLSVCGP
jgi:hypothetical protein